MEESALETDQQTEEPKPKATPPKLKASTTPKKSSSLGLTAKPKPTTTSSGKNVSAQATNANAGATLSKPPSRPTLSSTFMRPTASSTGATSLPRPRGSTSSTSSTDENAKPAVVKGEAKSKPALGAPKRLSTIGAVPSTRPTTERKPATQPPTNTAKKPVGRTSTLSPSKPPPPPSIGSRPTIKSSTSFSRAPGVADGKKRLSTIPDSPVVKKGGQSEYGKTADRQSVPEQDKPKALSRPSLGTRQSTRSATIQQSIREYGLVNDMLRAAMAAEDAGDDEQTGQLTTEVDEVITRLKANLEVTEEAPSEDKSVMLQESTEAVSTLKEQLDGTQATVDPLKQELDDLRTELARAQESQHEGITTAARQLETADAAHATEIEEVKKEHELAILSLHQKLQDLALSQQEKAEQALKDLEDAKRMAVEAGDVKTAEALEKQKALHTEVVDALESRLSGERKAIKDSVDKVSALEGEIEQHKATLAAVTSEAEKHETAVKTYQDQVAEKEQELQKQNNEIKCLQEEMHTVQRAKDTEMDELKWSSAKEIAELKEQMAGLKSETDRSSEESEVYIREEVNRQEKEISKLDQVIEHLQDEVQRVHESKSTERDEELFRARQDHDQLVMALKAEHQISVDGLAQSHNAVVEKLALEAQNSRTAHERQTQVLNDERAAVDQKLGETLDQLKSLQQESNKRMQEIEAQHAETVQAVGGKTETAEKALADSQRLMEELKASTEQATLSTVREFEEKISVLITESGKGKTALKNAQGDLEATQKQLQSLRHVLESVEKENQSREEHHNKALSKVITEAEAASKALSEYSSNIESVETNHANVIKDLKAQHETDVQTLRRDLLADRQAFSEMKTKHDSLQTVHDDLERQRREAEELKAEHETELQKLRRGLDQAHEQAFEELKAKYDSLQDAHSGLEKESREETRNLKSEHETNIQTLRKNIEQDHERAFQELKAKHDSLRAVQAEHENESRGETEKLNAEHEQALAESSELINILKQAHEGEIDEIKLLTANEKQEITIRLEHDFSYKFSESDKAHITALENLRDAHDETLSALRVELEQANQQSAATAESSYKTTIDQLRAELEEQKAALAKAKIEVGQASDLSKNAGVIELKGDLQEAKDDLTASRSEAMNLGSKVTELEGRLQKDQEAVRSMENSALESRNARADISRQVYMLKEQLDGALKEAEIQRADSDAAQKELLASGKHVTKLTAHMEELNAKLQDQTEKLEPDPKITTPTSARRRHRRKGSKNSPRGSHNKRTSGHDEGERTASMSQDREDENVAASVQGTMASIQEQVRQLDEVNEDMLEEHARMANMLSNVPKSPVSSPARVMAS